ncbi:MAG: FtsX-like permease family protein [Ruminococcus sp.]|nr:FtsX-like permease family protein [Ruminococcus sp.]
MYLNILTRDLKRKKTMNVILLIFVILSAMFMSSSVNNIMAVTTGLDYFYEKANGPDYIIFESGTEGSTLKETVMELDSVTDCRRESQLIGYGSDIEISGSDEEVSSGMHIYMPAENAQINYFDQNNKIINKVEKGKFYTTSAFAANNNLKVGDKLTITIGENEVELEYLGKAKDAVLGSNGFGTSKFIMNDDDYQHLYEGLTSKERVGNFYYIDTTDIEEVKEAINVFSGVSLDEEKATIKNTYIMDMIIAGILLIVSVFLIIASFVVLKHTIGFTIAEEFREIGVMKAIGIKNSSIRGLYLIKYFVITVVGSALGFVLSIPFSDMLLKSVSASMYLNSENNLVIGLLCSILVVGLTLLFCWTTTSKIKKLTPIDAVRSGQTGERFRKKSLIHLSKTKLPSNAFLAANDIVSAPKKYSVITSVFAILIMLVMVLANTANTLASEATLSLLGCIPSDAYIGTQVGTDYTTEDIEKILADNNMSGSVCQEKIYGIGAEINGKKTTLSCQHNPGKNINDYVYSEGVAPENANEISIAYAVAKEYDIEIGDEIILYVEGEEVECMVTALHQTMVRMGQANRIHKDFDVSSFSSVAMLDYQVDFDDELTEDELNKRIEKLKDILDTEKVQNTKGFARQATGAADTMGLVKNLVLIIVLAIVVLIAVLMERSFISADKSEIALMKAIGFSNKSIICHHTLRFGIVALVASLIAAALCLPVTKLTINPIFVIMGAVKGASYEIVFAEIFLLYPAILVAVAIIAAFFTSIYTNTIKSSDASNIE